MTLVGKGICFDTGGLDIKPASAMALMKKDMGGAAAALALAPSGHGGEAAVRLRVLIPAAENSIAGNAFRPGDVLTSRNGMTVEIGNTDAEGRLVLADALSLADEEAPDYLVTIATLTGAARVALGPDLPPLFTDDEDLAAGLLASGRSRRRSVVADAALGALRQAARERGRRHEPHRRRLLCGLGDGGAVPEALREQRQALRPSRHLRLGAARAAGRPQGGEPQAARALFDLLRQELGAVIDGVCPTRAATLIARILPPSRCATASRPRATCAGEARQLVVPVLPLRREPRFDATLDTEALFGETLTVYEESEGWAWVQLARDGYVGYMPREGLSPQHRRADAPGRGAAHLSLSRARRQTPPLAQLSLNALLSAAGPRRRFSRSRTAALSSPVMPSRSARPRARLRRRRRALSRHALSLGRTYRPRPRLLWPRAARARGGGLRCPRDTDMQQAELGRPIDWRRAELGRGDLVFWNGHVGIMRATTASCTPTPITWRS